MFEVALARMAEAEADVDEIQSLLGKRLRMRVIRESGFSTPTQGTRLRTCVELMLLALDRERPNVGDEAAEIDRSDRSAN